MHLPADWSALVLGERMPLQVIQVGTCIFPAWRPTAGVFQELKTGVAGCVAVISREAEIKSLAGLNCQSFRVK